MKFNDNPYYSPELCGLKIFESIDTAGSYEFDIFCIWKDLDTKKLLYDVDSGCSCPVPFEDGRHDLTPITEDTWYNFDEALKNHSRITRQDYLKIKNKVKNYLNKQK